MNPPPMTAFAQQFFALAGEPQPFSPHATYDPDGDCIEFFAKPDPFYGKRVDDLITVYRSQETDEVVGSLIKGVKHFYRTVLTKHPAYKIVVEDGGRVKIAHLFLANLMAKPKPTDKVETVVYRDLLRVAEESNAEAELCGAGT